MLKQTNTNLLLVGNDISSDVIIQNKLVHYGYLVDYISIEQELIKKVLNESKNIDFIIISNTNNRNVISDKVIKNINLPMLVLRTSLDVEWFLFDVEKNISELLERFNYDKEHNKADDFNEDQLAAFALHEIICDDRGTPINYRFLDADTKFLKRLNKTKDELIGKTALELYPRIEKIWIETFGRVALSGKPEVIVNYSIEFDNYYEARIYSPEKGKFLALFIDMMQIKDHMSVGNLANKT